MLNKINRILIVKLSSIGDVVHSLPTLKALRDTYKNAYIAWVIEEKSKDVIIGNKYLDEVIVFEKEKWKKELFKKVGFKESLKIIIDFAKLLRNKKFDLAIDLQGLMRSSLIAYFSGAKIRIGYNDTREASPLFYNLKVKSNKEIVHAVDRYLNIAKFLGADISKPDFHIAISREDEEFAHNFLKENLIKEDELIIGINPGASILHNRWEAEKFGKLSDILIEKYNAKIIVFGGKQDIELSKNMLEVMKNKVAVAVGKTTLKQLAALISKCSLFVGNDTGPLHIAVAMKTPTVAIFGPADPRRTGPYGNIHKIVYKNFPCSPCFRHPTCKDYKCMKEISVEDVLEATEEQLKEIKKRREEILF
jgi:lipopolysaccharide heptosyltransferase I